MPISEEDALGALALAEANRNNPAVVLKAKDIAVAYKAQQKAAGLPMFPNQERAREEQYSKIKGFYTDPNHGLDEETLGFVNETLRGSEDSKYKIFNKKYFEFHGIPKDQVDSQADQLINAYGLQEFKKPISSHREFFDSISADFKAEKQVEDMAREFTLAKMGPLDSEAQFRERMASVPGYAGREAKWRDQFLKNKEFLDGKRDQYSNDIWLLSNGIERKNLEGTVSPVARFSKFGGAEEPTEAGLQRRQEILESPSNAELAEVLMEVPAEDRPFVIAAAAADAAKDPNGRKDFMLNLADRVGRGFDQYVEGFPLLEKKTRAIGIKGLIRSGFPISEEDAATPESLFAAAASALKTQTSAGLSMMGDLAPISEPTPSATASEETKAGALKLADRLIEAADLTTAIRNAAEQDVDPITSEFAVVRGMYALAGSIPYMAASALPGGALVNTAAFAEQGYQMVRGINPNMSAEQAYSIGVIAAPFMTFIERMQIRGATGQLTSVNRFFNEVIATPGGATSRFLTRTAATTGVQLVQENVQDLAPFMVQGLLSAVSEDMPNVPVELLYKDMVAQQPELFFSILPLAVMGGAVGTYSDFRNGRALLSSYDELRAHGLSEAASANIRALANQGNYDGAQSLLREEFKTLGKDQKSVQEARLEALPKLLEEYKAQRLALDSGIELDILPAILQQRGGKTALRFKSGEELQFDSHAEAMERFNAVASSAVLAIHRDYITAAAMTTSQLEKGREVKFIFSPLDPTTEELAEQGVATEEQLQKRKEIEQLDSTPEGEEQLAQTLTQLAANSSEARKASSYVAGSSQNTEAAPDSFGDRVIRTTSRLYQRATPLTLIEETAEGDIKFMITEGKVSRQWIIGALRQWETNTGDKLFRKSITDDSQIENQDIVEAYSTMVVGYFAGRAKAGDQGRVFSKEFRSEIAKALRGDMGAVMTGYAAIFKAVYRRAAMIEKARKEKTLPADLESFLAKSAGMSPQKVFEREVVKEGEGIAEEMGVEFVDEQTFSTVTPAQATPQGKRHAELEAKFNAGTITPEETAEAQQLVEQRAKAAGYSIESLHGTNGDEFTVFDLERGGDKTAAESATMGIFSTDNMTVAEMYAANMGMGGAFTLAFGSEDSPLVKARNAALASEEGKRLSKALEEAQQNIQDVAKAEFNKLKQDMLEKLLKSKEEGNFKGIDDSMFEQMAEVSAQSQFFRANQANENPAITAAYQQEQDAESALHDYVRPLIDAAIPNKRVLKLFIKLQNPAVYDAEGKTPAGFPLSEKILAAKNAGNDGVVFENIVDPNESATHYVVFSPNQVKSADPFTGVPLDQRFDQTRDEITFSTITPAVDAEYLALAADPVKNQARLQVMVDTAAKKAGLQGPWFHGSDAEKMVGEFRVGERDSGWFGVGAYLTNFENYAKRWGRNVHRFYTPNGKYAEATVVGNYERVDFDSATEKADRDAGGNDRWLEDENGYSEDFASSMLKQGYIGARIAFGSNKDVEVVVFDPSQIKSADPVTYDESGNVIPLSQRFNPARDEISFSTITPDPNEHVFEAVYLKHEKRFKKAIRDGRARLGVSIGEFIKKAVLLHQPDTAVSGSVAFAGEEVVVGQGGVYYPLLFDALNYFWASTENAAKGMAERLNEISRANGGKIYMALTSAPITKLFSSTTMSSGVVDILAKVAKYPKRYGLTPDDVVKIISVASSLKLEKKLKNKKTGVTRTVVKSFTNPVPENVSLPKAVKLIKAELAADKSTFDIRHKFVKSIAAQIAKALADKPEQSKRFANLLVGETNEFAKGPMRKGKLSEVAILQGLGDLLSEPFLKTFQNVKTGGYVYAVIEMDGEVEAVPSDLHKSYPFAIRSTSKKKPTVHLIDKARKWHDVVSIKGQKGYVAKENYTKVYPTSGVSSKSYGTLVFTKPNPKGEEGVDITSFSTVTPAADSRAAKIKKKNSLRIQMSRSALTDAALNQASWRDWYDEHQEVLDDFFGDYAPLFQDILSITSQAASVKANVSLALRAFGYYVRGEPFDGTKRGEETPGFLAGVIMNLDRLRSDKQIQGQKIKAYKASNDGAVDQAVIDRHISRLLFGVETPSAAQFAKAQKVLSQIAKEIGWTARQVQAALWAHSIYKSGKTPESYGDYLTKLESKRTLAKRIGDIAGAGAGRNADGGGRGRFAPAGAAPGETTFSVIRPIGDIDSRFTAMFSPFQRSPELRAKLGIALREKTSNVENELGPIIRAFYRTKAEVQREANVREGVEYDRLLRETFGADTQAKQEALPLVDRKAARSDAKRVAKQWMDGEMKKKEVAPREVLIGFLRTLDAIQRTLPVEVRGKIGGFVAMAKLTTPAAMLEEIESRVERIDKELEKYLKKEAEVRRKKLFKLAKPKREAGKKPKGKAGADIHDLFDRLAEAMLWDGAKAEGWAATLEAQIASGDLSPEAEAHAKIEANLVRLFSDWNDTYIDTGKKGKNGRRIVKLNSRGADAARRTAAVEAAEEVYKAGYIDEQKRIAKERERRAQIRADIIAGTGKLGDRPERVAKSQKDAGLSGQWKEWFLSLFNFEQVLGFAFGDNSKWTKWFSDQQRTAENQKLDEIQSVLDGLDALFRKLGGSRLGGEKLQWKLSQPSFETKKGGKMSELEGITAILMWRQEDGKRHMAGKRDENGKITSTWAYDQAFVDEIQSKLSAEALEVMDYLVNQYAGEYETINPIFREINGINLPRNDKYSPLSVKPQQAPNGQTTDPVTGSTMSNGSMTPGSFRTRAQVVAEPDFRNAVEVFVGHKKQLAHWKAYAVFIRDAQGVLGNREVSNSIEASSGQEAVRVIRSWLDLFAQGGVRDAGAHLALTKALSGAMGRASAIQLVGRVGTLAIQATQLGAASAKMPFISYASRLSKLLTGRLSWADALNSPYIQRRLAQMPPSVQIAMEGLRAGKPNAVKHAVQRIGSLLAGTDALFTAGTFAIVYDYQLTKSLKAGVDPVTAAEVARNEAERIVDEIAQPTRQGTRSLFESTTTNPLGRVAWAFASEARKNMALVAYTGAKRPVGELSRALLYVVVFNGVLSSLIRTAWKDLRDDDEDEDEWSLQRILLSVATEPLYGFPGFGEIAQDAIFAAAGEYKPSGSILDAPKKIPTAIVRAPENFQMLLEGDLEQPLRDLETLLMAGGLFNDNIAAVSSLAHIVRDAEALIRNFTQD
jgi:hypothetical protein